MERTVLLVLVGVLVYLTYLVASPFLAPLCWAVALVIFAYPLHRRVQKRVSGETRAALATTLILVIILVGPVLTIAAGATYQAIGLAHWFQDQVKQGRKPILEWARGKPLELLHQYLPKDVEKAQVEEYLTGKAHAWVAYVVTQAPRMLGIFTTVLMNLFVIFLATFSLLRDGPAVLDLVRRVLPLDKSQQDRFFSLVANTIHASLFSSLAIAAVQGALGGLLFAMLGIGRPMMWGVIMAFLSLIPMLGSALVWVPAAIILAVNGHVAKAVILVAAGVLVIGTADNILRPILMKGRSEMSELLVFVSVIGGLAVFGMVGIVLGPLVAALALASLQMYAATRASSEVQ